MTPQELKKLQRQLKELESNKDALRQEISYKQKLLNTTQDTINKMKVKVAKVSSQDKIVLSEHATLRFLERVKELDLKQIQAEIIDDNLKETLATLGGTANIKKDNYTIVVKDYIIVTITK